MRRAAQRVAVLDRMLEPLAARVAERLVGGPTTSPCSRASVEPASSARIVAALRDLPGVRLLRVDERRRGGRGCRAAPRPSARCTASATAPARPRRSAAITANPRHERGAVDQRQRLLRLAAPAAPARTRAAPRPPARSTRACSTCAAAGEHVGDVAERDQVAAGADRSAFRDHRQDVVAQAVREQLDDLAAGRRSSRAPGSWRGQHVARTTSAGACGPLPTRWYRTSACCSAAARSAAIWWCCCRRSRSSRRRPAGRSRRPRRGSHRLLDPLGGRRIERDRGEPGRRASRRHLGGRSVSSPRTTEATVPARRRTASAAAPCRHRRARTRPRRGGPAPG